MEPTARPPWIPELYAGRDKPSGWLGTGAIAAPMAVSFREEKLALHAPGLSNVEHGSSLHSEGPRE